jgi:hypothetical protein
MKGLVYASLAIVFSALPLPAVVVSRRLKSAIQSGFTLKSIQEIRTVATVARDERIAIDPKLAETVALHVMKIAIQENQWPEQALQAAMAISSYISFLNAGYSAPIKSKPFIPGTRKMTTPLDHFIRDPKKQSALIITSGLENVKDEDAAVIERIGDGHEFEKGYGSAVYLISGYNGYLLLDGLYFKNIVFQELSIAYQGGPLVLINVRFIDCTFDVSGTAAGLLLLEAVTKFLTLTFKNPMV